MTNLFTKKVVELLLRCKKNFHLVQNSEPFIYKSLIITSPISFNITLE